MRHRRSISTRRADTELADAQACHATQPSARRPVRRTTLLAALIGLLALALPSFIVGATSATATATFVVRDVATNALVTDFTYLVSVDNAGRRTDVFTERPGVKPTPSYIPLVGAGDDTDPSADLDAPGRYLVTVKAPGYKLWGQHFDLTGNTQVEIKLKQHPLPLGKLVVHAFHDRQPVNAAPDAAAGEPGLGGFEVRLHDTVGEMQADYNGDPLCGVGQCLTDGEGNVTIPNLAPGRYEIEVLPPDGTDWVQTTTFEGTHLIDFGRVTENDNGLGALDERGLAANIDTAWWFGFVQPLELDPLACTPSSPCGTVSGTARTWVGWPPYDTIDLGDPVREAIVALSDVSGTDEQVYTGFADPDTGEFAIENIPDGTYTLSIFDTNLDWIMRFATFTLPDPVTGLRVIDLNVADVNLEQGVPVARWFGTVSGFVFEDNGLDPFGGPIGGPEAAGNRIRDCDPGDASRCEEGLDGIDLDLRWRDGSVKSTTFTGSHQVTGESGYYEYPELLSPLSKFLISEVGFGRFARTGMSLHDELNPEVVIPLPTDLGGGLLLNQLTAEGHESWVDWGKREYGPLEHGGITGVVFHATTRNEFSPALGAAEDYEPGIPGTTVKLWGPGPDGVWDTPDTAIPDDVLVNEVEADTWSHPRSDGELAQSCDVRDASGALLLPTFIPDIQPNCTEFPALGNETKDGAFDGGYAIETMVRDPDTGLVIDETLLEVGRDYVIEVVPPAFYQVMKEEDQNTDEGDALEPQLPPPPCVGPLHLVNDERNPAHGTETPLCTKKLVTLEDGQNPAADFFLFTDDDADPATNTSYDDPGTPDTNEDVSWNTLESIAPPGRIFGFVGDDLRFDQDPTSPWYGQPLALPNIPVGVYDYTGRRITMLHTDEFGFYDVTLPSSQTYNCPTPSGVCPGMYTLRIDDPADPATFNPDYLTAALAFDVWPGKTTYADTPVDPISALVCTFGQVAEGQAQQTEFFRVSNPYITLGNGAAARELTIDGAGFGAIRGTGQVTLGGSALPAAAYLAWSDRQIRVRVPSDLVSPGPRQLLIRGASGIWTPLGITIHVRQSGSSYFPTIRNVLATGTVQAVIEAAGAGDLIVVRPGTHIENVILHKRVKLQGVGPGGTLGGEGANPDDLRFTIVGSVINARNFFDRETAWNAQLNTLKTTGTGIAGNQTIRGGSAITVVARTTTQYSNGSGRAMIDGLGVTLAQSTLVPGLGASAGGIQVNAYARNLQISNNILENNGGGIGGGIALGTPVWVDRTGPLDNQNDNVRITYNRILGNGSLTNGGGVAIYNGAESYLVERNQICSNYSVTYGAGVGHFGSSGGTNRIQDNNIYGNEAFDSGSGLMVSGELPVTGGGVGTGRVDLRRNYAWFNLSNDDGGGMFIRDTRTSEINLASNIVANNVATDMGGGVALDDVPNARIVNNTFVRNASTDTAEDRDFLPNGAGLVSESNDSGPGFSNPVAFFNNIFWQNEAFTFDGADLVSQGFFDLEVIGPGVFTPRTSLLTQLDPANFTNPGGIFTNQIGVNPLFVNEFINEIAAGPSLFGPAGEIQTTLFRHDPPPPFNGSAPGDYHLTAASPALTRLGGAVASIWQSPIVIAPRCDIDRQERPLLLAPRGADWRGPPAPAAPVEECSS